jgi:hypothetical protein
MPHRVERLFQAPTRMARELARPEPGRNLRCRRLASRILRLKRGTFQRQGFCHQGLRDLERQRTAGEHFARCIPWRIRLGGDKLQLDFVQFALVIPEPCGPALGYHAQSVVPGPLA